MTRKTMRHSHKVGLAGVFACLTGCTEVPELTPLTEAQKDALKEMIVTNEASLSIYSKLMEHADETISADGDKSLEDFTEDLKTAHDLTKRYLKEDRIYGFDGEEKVSGRDDAAFFHIDILEENQYIGISLYTDEETGEKKISIFPSDLLHEGGHDKMGEHSDKVEDLAEKETEDASYASDFANAVKEKKDFCYALTILGKISDHLYMTNNLTNIEALMWYGEKLSTQEGAEAEATRSNLDRLYLEVEGAPILEDQETWARLTIESYFRVPGLEEQFNALGITREELIDVYATEENIYPEYRAEYEKALNEFLERYGDELSGENVKENQEGNEAVTASEKKETMQEVYFQRPRMR